MNYVEIIKNLLSEIDDLVKENNLTLYDKNKSIYAQAKSSIDYLEYWSEEECETLKANLEKVYNNLLSLRENSDAQKEYVYPFGLKFSDFKNLIEVSNGDATHTTYIYFMPEMIRDYKTAIQNGHDQLFVGLLQQPEFCRGKRENGIKAIVGQNETKCEAWINNQKYDTIFTHELKINAAARIGFFSLKSENNGPVILIASHYLEHGLHSERKEEKDKPHKTGNFFVKPSPAQQCGRIGIFAQNGRTSPAAAESNPSNTPAAASTYQR